MAIGTTAAILGSAVIGAGASAIAGSKNSKAINSATAAQQEGNAQSLALQKSVFDTNRATLNPFVQRGNVAGDQINALLGLGGSQVQGGPANVGALPGYGQPNALSQFQPAASRYGLGDSPGFSYGSDAGGYNGGFNPAANQQFAQYVQANPDLQAEFGRVGAQFGNDPAAYGQFHYSKYGQNEGRALPAMGGMPQGAQQGQTAQGAAENAFDIFRNSTGYKFRLGEGLDAVNSGWAGNGLLQSGAALRGITEYGQNFASNEFGNYMGLLSGQQGTGLQAAGAQAGVGVNYANAASNINSANANALSNAAVARANNSNAVIGGFGNALGGAIGSLAYQPRG